MSLVAPDTDRRLPHRNKSNRHTITYIFPQGNRQHTFTSPMAEPVRTIWPPTSASPLEIILQQFQVGILACACPSATSAPSDQINQDLLQQKPAPGSWEERETVPAAGQDAQAAMCSRAVSCIPYVPNETAQEQGTHSLAKHKYSPHRN